MGNACMAPKGSRRLQEKEPNENRNKISKWCNKTMSSHPKKKNILPKNNDILPKNNNILSDLTGTDVRRRYELGQELGRGCFGVTYICIHRETGERYACKSVEKTKLFNNKYNIEAMQMEVEIMRHLPSHPNLVKMKDIFEDDHAIHLVMELCEGGDLENNILVKGKYYSERAAKAFAKDILQAVKVMHDNGIMHRDIKPSNCLVKSISSSSVYKLTDFGLSRDFLPGHKYRAISGSYMYMAPELINRNYGPEVDLWSLGVSIYELLSLQPPFWDDDTEVLKRIITTSDVKFEGNRWAQISEEAKDFIKKLLTRDPAARLTTREALEHPWLQKKKKDAVYLQRTTLGR